MGHQLAEQLRISAGIRKFQAGQKEKESVIRDFIAKEQVKQDLNNRAEQQKIIEAQKRGRKQSEFIQAPSATFAIPELPFQLTYPSGAPIQAPAREVPLDAPPEVKERFDRSKLLSKGPTSPLQEAFKGSEARRQHIQQLFESGELDKAQTEISAFLKEEAQSKKVAGSRRPSVGTAREGMASTLFGPEFGMLDQSQKKVVDRKIFNEKLKLKAAEGASKSIAELQFGLRQQRGRVAVVIDSVNRVQSEIQKDPAILGVPGAISRTITSTVDQAKAMANIIEPGLFESFDEIDKHANLFRETGISSAKLQGQILSLAISLALAEGFSGRGITDRKIELNLKRLSGAVSGRSANIMFNTLEQIKQELVASFNESIAGSPSGVEEALSPPQLIPAQQQRIFITPQADIPEAGEVEIKILRRRPAE
jgi:hypothetical protein